ncbi:FMN-binding negative transcriptional regulator [Asticcacaulis sp. 201]|uniref:FMN-binding negative transcriptional regulator n=1 Tax=Asticcacaulis sp. 201 TaxID=3028787 RepID=UPI002916F704|nr:FMN-binding negative transcriptional regulator [Asticcacaulis sp. 201]MDV6330954.1 FMN-binding negative transcriptional regulator [Asticcacaulis sp. 201]
MSPSLFRAEPYIAADPAAIVRDYPFATLILPNLSATTTAIVFETDDSTRTLIGHMAGRNPQAKAMHTGDKVLTIFTGPHAYISPRWYVEKPEVPTWNYIAAHVRGTLEVIEDDAGQTEVLRRTIEVAEGGFDDPWTIDMAAEGRVAFLLPKIRSFRIHIDTIEGTTKLSQTHPEGDRHRIIAGLKDRVYPTISDLMT